MEVLIYVFMALIVLVNIANVMKKDCAVDVYKKEYGGVTLGVCLLLLMPSILINLRRSRP